MYQYTILPTAYEELLDAWEWYEDIQEGLGDRFKAQVFRAINKVARNPLHYLERTTSFREAQLDVFPYLVVYQFHLDKRHILVVSVFHCKRNPKLKYR